MRPELDETLAAGGASPDPMRTATAPRVGDEPAATLAEGQQLGHFRIERPLGAGGMGEVYLATDLALDRPVAIKVLPAGVARDPARRDRMVREARSQARITHPNVGHMYFIGEESGRLYFAMEYVAGETLSARLAKGPLPVDDALAIIRSAALGLREAQRAGITHRDIKPSNLMIDGHGMVKVLDFGLAASSSATADGAARGDAPVAQTSLAGTPLYMAPEQARGEPVNFQADIYALGATLYHLVSGRPPFEADSLDALLSKHASAERPTVPRRAGLPRTTIAAVDALCSKMMAPRPGDRFASYDELIRAIELSSVEHARPAGFWVRSMASLADLLLASVVCLVLFGLAELVIRRGGGDLNLLGYAIYTFGAIALLARNGRTPGQSLFEIEVVDAQTGGKPSLGKAAIRVIVPLAIPFAEKLLEFGLGLGGVSLPKWASVAMSGMILAVPAALLWASLRSHSKRTVWDKLSGTLVRYRTRRTTTL